MSEWVINAKNNVIGIDFEYLLETQIFTKEIMYKNNDKRKHTLKMLKLTAIMREYIV